MHCYVFLDHSIDEHCNSSSLLTEADDRLSSVTPVSDNLAFVICDDSEWHRLSSVTPVSDNLAFVLNAFANDICNQSYSYAL